MHWFDMLLLLFFGFVGMVGFLMVMEGVIDTLARSEALNRHD